MDFKEADETPNFSILDSFSESIWAINKSGTVVYINKGYENNLEEPCKLISDLKVNSNFLELCRSFVNHSSRANAIINGIESVINETTKEFYFEYQCECQYDKNEKWYSIKCVPLACNNNYFLVMSVNITKRTLMKKELSDYSKNCLKFFNNNSCIALIVNSTTGNILGANDIACEFYGYSQDAIKSKTIYEIAVSNNAENFFEEKCFEQCHKLSNGEQIEVEVQSMLISYEEQMHYFLIVHDISQKTRIKRYLKEYQEKYRSLVELSTDAVFILNEKKIVFSNYSGLKMLGISSVYDLLKFNFTDLLDFSDPDNRKFYILVRDIVEKGITVQMSEHKIISLTRDVFYLEIGATPINYKGEIFAQIVARDVTKFKKELQRAYDVKRRYISFDFPLDNMAEMESIYLPAKNLSGDYFKLIKINDNLVVGLIGDVSGKDIIAALNTSALNILFNDSILISKDPLEIINHINAQMLRHFHEEYIAACCFSFDFQKMQLTLAGAGINEIAFLQQGKTYTILETKGSFLGMFEETLSEKVTINFSPGDLFFFYTDGMDFILNSEDVKSQILDFTMLSEIKNYIAEILMSQQTLHDDSSWFGIKIT